MIKAIITMVVTAIAGLVGYLVSDSFRERLAQKQRERFKNRLKRRESKTGLFGGGCLVVGGGGKAEQKAAGQGGGGSGLGRP